MEYNEFLNQYDDTLKTKPDHIRAGQALMILLHKVWELEYNRIAYKSFLIYGLTNIDCFYVDNLIPNTLKHLQSIWHKYPL